MYEWGINNYSKEEAMAQVITTSQNQNLTKTFLTAFAGMLLAVPIVALVTIAVVRAELSSQVYAESAHRGGPAISQANTAPEVPAPSAPVACVAPAISQANTAGSGGSVAGAMGLGWGRGGSISGSFNQTNTYSVSTTNTTTITKTKTISDSFNKTKVVVANNGN